MICSNDILATRLRDSLLVWEAQPRSISAGYQVVRALDRFIYKDEIAFASHDNPGLANLKPWVNRLLQNSEHARKMLERTALRPGLKAEGDYLLATCLAESDRYLLPRLSSVQERMMMGAMGSSVSSDLGLLSEYVAVKAEVYRALLTAAATTEETSFLTIGGEAIVPKTLEAKLESAIFTRCAKGVSLLEARTFTTFAGEVEGVMLVPQTLEVEMATMRRCSGFFANLSNFCQKDLRLKIAALGTLAVAGFVLAVIHSDSFSESSLS